MPIVGGPDIHRKQLTFHYLDTDTGEVKRGQVAPPTGSTCARGWRGPPVGVTARLRWRGAPAGATSRRSWSKRLGAPRDRAGWAGHPDAATLGRVLARIDHGQ